MKRERFTSKKTFTGTTRLKRALPNKQKAATDYTDYTDY